MDEQLKRFFAKIDKTDTCWLWKGSTTKGYGKLTANKRLIYAHRYSYERFIGPIPTGLLVLHRCDVPNCVNPEHLWIGTDLDNTRDRQAKGRGKPGGGIGEQNCKAKLTAAKVIEMRRLYHTQSFSFTQIAQLFGVTKFTARHAVLRKTWKHV